MAKTVLYHVTWKAKAKVVAVMMRGDLEINEVKLTNALDALAVRLATDDEIKAATGADVGYAGPVNLPEDVPLLADESLQGVTNLLTGGNKTGYHCLDVNLGRDCRMPSWKELRTARAGEGCPVSGKPLEQARGIEVGHIFKLGVKYSKAMQATFMDQGGKPVPFVMGCYGIGVSRTMASSVEQNHDVDGIVWPAAIAPFHVLITLMKPELAEHVKLARDLADQLAARGIDVLIDDRDERAGVKFKDADLIGVPIRLTIGDKALAAGAVEFKKRADRTGKGELCPVADVVDWCVAGLRAEKAS
jgi:prolyl-tRNA synthetase